MDPDSSNFSFLWNQPFNIHYFLLDIKLQYLIILIFIQVENSDEITPIQNHSDSIDIFERTVIKLVTRE